MYILYFSLLGLYIWFIVNYFYPKDYGVYNTILQCTMIYNILIHSEERKFNV